MLTRRLQPMIVKPLISGIKSKLENPDKSNIDALDLGLRAVEYLSMHYRIKDDRKRLLSQLANGLSKVDLIYNTIHPIQKIFLLFDLVDDQTKISFVEKYLPQYHRQLEEGKFWLRMMQRLQHGRDAVSQLRNTIANTGDKLSLYVGRTTRKEYFENKLMAMLKHQTDTVDAELTSMVGKLSHYYAMKEEDENLLALFAQMVQKDPTLRKYIWDKLSSKQQILLMYDLVSDDAKLKLLKTAESDELGKTRTLLDGLKLIKSVVKFHQQTHTSEAMKAYSQRSGRSRRRHRRKRHY